MIKLQLPLLAITAVIAASSAHGGGDKLLAECSQVIQFTETGEFEKADAGASYCLGMVKGMMTLNTIYQSRPQTAPLFCPPATTVTNAEGARIVVRYLESHPEEMDMDAGSLMFFALQDAFPCER